MYFWNTKSPLGSYVKLYSDFYISNQQETIESKGIELRSNELAISLNILIVGVEKYLNSLDRELCKILNGKFGFSWPSTNSKWPQKSVSKPYNFYYYDIKKVLSHWNRYLNLRISYKGIRKVIDCVQFRHIWSHCAGVVDYKNMKKFHYFKVKENELLYPNYAGYNDLVQTLWNFVKEINNALGIELLKKLRKDGFTCMWKSDKKLFISIMDAFSWFGALKQNNELAKKMYQYVKIRKYVFSGLFDSN
jgi:hypothetical protein